MAGLPDLHPRRPHGSARARPALRASLVRARGETAVARAAQPPCC
jgi:hypothetical protein